MTQIGLKAELKKKGAWNSPEQEALMNLMRTNSMFACRADRFFRGHGISSPQYNILRILRGHDGQGLPSLEIASQMIAIVPDITRLLDRLENAGYVKRQRSTEDRRVVFVGITRKGLQRLAKIDKSIADQNRILLGHLSRRELETLNRLLVKARSSVETNTQPDRSS